MFSYFRNLFIDTRPRDGWRRRPWTGEELRGIRAAKGVGRLHQDEDRHAPTVDAWVRRCDQVNRMYDQWWTAKLQRKRDALDRAEHRAWQLEIAASMRDAAL